MIKVRLFYCCLAVLLFACNSDVKNLETTNNEIEEKVESIDFISSKIDSCLTNIQLTFEYRLPEERFNIYEEDLYSSKLLPKVYVENNFYPLWLKSSNDLVRLDSFLKYIEQLEYHGFNPSDYHLDALKAIRSELTAESSSPYLIAAIDILASDAFLLIASHLYNGKINPESLKTEWGIQRQRPELALDEKLCKIVYSDSIHEFMELFYPKNRYYTNVVEEVKFLKDNITQEEKIQIPSNRLTLDVDQDSTYNYEIAKRLEELGYLQRDTSFYEDSLTHLLDGIKKLQTSFGLIPDGRVGLNTLEAMNLSKEEKLKKLLVNLERMRWLPEEKTARRVLVNIADFTLDFMEDEDTIIHMRTVVGRDFRQTPVFEAKMTYLVFSPTWTIPPGILRNDVLPAVAKDMAYLAKNNMVVLDRSGKKIDANSIDWKKARTGNFPYMIRQMPGDNNALGRVKFMFPNKFNVYLHDTPSKNLFDRDNRTFSSGCIRVEQPTELAFHLLQDTVNWNYPTIRQNMGLKNERTVVLKNPVGVYIYYLTAWGSKEGVYYRKDIYSRDEELYLALTKQNKKV